MNSTELLNSLFGEELWDFLQGELENLPPTPPPELPDFSNAFPFLAHWGDAIHSIFEDANINPDFSNPIPSLAPWNEGIHSILEDANPDFSNAILAQWNEGIHSIFEDANINPDDLSIPGLSEWHDAVDSIFQDIGALPPQPEGIGAIDNPISFLPLGQELSNLIGDITNHSALF